MDQTTKRRTWRPWREALVHLFVLGLAVFALHAVLNRESSPTDEDPHLIEISSAELDWFQTMWTKRMGRMPTAQEIRGQIDQLIRERILEREARGMNLDREDTVVRRRLSQKMDFLFQDLGALVEPNETQLRDYYEGKLERYEEPGRVTFTQVCFSSDPCGVEKASLAAKEQLAQLRAEETRPDQAASLGDVTLLPTLCRDQTPLDVANQFGAAFQEAVQGLPLKSWQGPVASGLGQHVVFVHSRTEGAVPAFEQIRETVAADWRAEQQRRSKRRAYLNLRQKYQVLVEGMPYASDKSVPVLRSASACRQHPTGLPGNQRGRTRKPVHSLEGPLWPGR
jgi:hypothetical protein